MATSAIPDSALAHRANLNIAAEVVAKCGASVPDSLIGGAIDTVRASHSVTELANADNNPARQPRMKPIAQVGRHVGVDSVTMARGSQQFLDRTVTTRLNNL